MEPEGSLPHSQVSATCPYPEPDQSRQILATYNQRYDRYMGHAVSQLVEALCYEPEDCGFHSRWCHWSFLLTETFLPHYGHGVDPSSNRNEYQEYFLGVKAAGV
jgi:hypothetical protein